MKEELKKSLTDLIDETLLELEELKKSRFSAAEVKIEGPGADGIAGKPANGKLGAEKSEAEKAEEAAKAEAEKAEAEKAEAEKAEAAKSEVEPGVKKTEGINIEKAEDKKEDKKDEDKKEPHEDPEHEKKEMELAEKLKSMHKSVEDLQGLKKSVDGMETLMKSYVDEKLAPVQTQLATILEAVKKLADAPVPAKGVSYKGVAPLAKSDETAETLTKSEVASKLWELKKSGTRVDSTDIARAEMGHDLDKIIAKYDVK